jgi:hypothetical protein
MKFKDLFRPQQFYFFAQVSIKHTHVFQIVVKGLLHLNVLDFYCYVTR